MRHRPARPEGNLDYCASGLLSAGADDLLGSAQVCRPKSVAISPSQRVIARRLSHFALARPETTPSARRVARRCTVGFAPCDGAIGRLDYRGKEHAVLRILSALDPFLFELGGSRRGGL